MTIAYRRRLIDSPSYTLNHEEVAKALEEGIRFAERLTPEAVEVDHYGHAAALLVKNAAGESLRMPAKAILVAAGTQPNTVLGREDPHNVFLDGKWFQAVDEDGHPVTPERVAKPAASRVLTLAARRRPRHQLLRRSASLLRRQRREGDGQRQAGLSGGLANARAARALGFSQYRSI